MSITQAFAAWLMSLGLDPTDSAVLGVSLLVAGPLFIAIALVAWMERRNRLSLVVAVVVDGKLVGAMRLTESQLAKGDSAS